MADHPLTPLTKGNKTEYKQIDDDDTQSFHEANKTLPPQKRKKYFFILLVIIIIAAAVGLVAYFLLQEDKSTQKWPIVASTWPWTQPIENAWSNIIQHDNSLYAVQIGCETCEQDPESCDWSVGWGGSPDETGEVRLDALIMYGPTHEAGAVASLKNIKNAIGVARYVMHYTTHTMLVGQSATDFAIQMGFEPESLNGSESWKLHQEYLDDNCQPNSWQNVIDFNTSCPPYTPIPFNYSDIFMSKRYVNKKEWNLGDHDTIGMIGIDSNGYMSIGTSTNGGTNKIPGRVGDSPIIGSGGYVEQGVGGAVGTGDGDIMMRFNPTHAAVFYMKQGMNVREACWEAMDDIVKYYYGVYASLVCMDANGNHAGANAAPAFAYTYRDSDVDEATVVWVDSPYDD
eukprot:100494_1